MLPQERASLARFITQMQNGFVKCNFINSRTKEKQGSTFRVLFISSIPAGGILSKESEVILTFRCRMRCSFVKGEERWQRQVGEAEKSTTEEEREREKGNNETVK